MEGYLFSSKTPLLIHPCKIQPASIFFPHAITSVIRPQAHSSAWRPPRPLKSRPFFWILYACSRACAALSDHVLLTPSLAHSGSLQEFHASFQKKKPAISRARILYCNSPWAILMVLGLLAMLDLQVEIFGLEPIPIWSIKDWVFKSAWVIGCLLIQEHKASSSWLHPFLIT